MANNNLPNRSIEEIAPTLHGADFEATGIRIHRCADGNSPVWPIGARQFLAPIRVGFPPYNNENYLTFWKSGTWRTLNPVLDEEETLAYARLHVTHWMELPGDPT